MLYNASEIARIIGSPLPVHPQAGIDSLLIDSRMLNEANGALFFAIATSTNDGHRYIAELYGKGVRNFVVTKLPDSDFPDANFFVVNNVVEALQRIAAHHRRRFDIPLIAITGSRGKTTLKEWLYQMLLPDYHIARSPRSYNSQLGVPLSIWSIDHDTTLGIIEAGVSLPGEMSSLQLIIAPTIGIITNIGDEHRRGFPSIEAKAAEKISLFKSCSTIIYDADDPIVAQAINGASLSAKYIGWSRINPDSPLFISSVTTTHNLSTINYNYLGGENSVIIPFTGPNDVQNAIHLLATMLILGIPYDTIARRMRHLAPVNTRLNVIDGVNNCQIVNDTYTADFHSLAPALDFMARQSNAHRSSTVILSNLKHESQSPEGEYMAAAKLLKLRNVKRIIGIGDEISRHISTFAPNATCYASTSDFLAKTSPSDFVDEAILIKGAPEFHFERIAQALEAKHHETVLEVNLDALVNNFNVYRSMLHPSTGIVAMVKASGYGAGVIEPAKTLQAQGAAYLAVAVVDEGVELRQAGITMPIMVMNPKVVNFRALFANQLEPVIYSFDMLYDVIREAQKCNIKGYPIHIKLDTGMHRLGFLEADIPALAEQLKNQDIVEPRSIFSHLATADCPDMEGYTHGQLQTFERATALLQRLYPRRILRHILNTAGIERFNTHQYDMVRLGIGLYGLTPEPWLSESTPLSALRPVSTLRTVIISIKKWPKGTAIGYSRRGILERDSQIATIPIGYADGLNRHCGNGHINVLVNGVQCPTVGNICMDLCMIDVTDANASVGDSVEIFGENQPIQLIAEATDTIPYEILTSVSPRVKRIYFRE